MTELRDKRADTAARKLLLAGIDARPGRGAMFVASPAEQFRRLDRGGRTMNERMITRAVYHQTTADPRHWSAKLTWGPIERRGRQWGRTVRIRVYLYRSGLRHSLEHPRQSYAQHEENRTYPGQRIDQ